MITIIIMVIIIITIIMIIITMVIINSYFVNDLMIWVMLNLMMFCFLILEWHVIFPDNMFKLAGLIKLNIPIGDCLYLSIRKKNATSSQSTPAVCWVIINVIITWSLKIVMCLLKQDKINIY